MIAPDVSVVFYMMLMPLNGSGFSITLSPHLPFSQRIFRFQELLVIRSINDISYSRLLSIGPISFSLTISQSNTFHCHWIVRTGDTEHHYHGISVRTKNTLLDHCGQIRLCIGVYCYSLT